MPASTVAATTIVAAVASRRAPGGPHSPEYCRFSGSLLRSARPCLGRQWRGRRSGVRSSPERHSHQPVDAHVTPTKKKNTPLNIGGTEASWKPKKLKKPERELKLGPDGHYDSCSFVKITNVLSPLSSVVRFPLTCLLLSDASQALSHCTHVATAADVGRTAAPRSSLPRRRLAASCCCGPLEYHSIAILAAAIAVFACRFCWCCWWCCWCWCWCCWCC